MLHIDLVNFFDMWILGSAKLHFHISLTNLISAGVHFIHNIVFVSGQIQFLKVEEMTSLCQTCVAFNKVARTEFDYMYLPLAWQTDLSN